jgi:superfamily II DNA or RNA helicase
MAGDSTPKQTIQRMGRVLRKKTDGTISSLYQIYCYNTIEEEYAVIRSKLFKELASYFNDYFYGLGQNFELED